MELTLALADTQRAFDGVAPTYHADNEANPIVRTMRDRTLALVRSHIAPSSRLLDLGCGPGTDAVRLAAEGHHVTAIDWSPAMVRQAQDRVAARGLDACVTVRALGIHELDRLGGGPFDAAYADLGPLNCVPDLPAAAGAIARQLRPGGVLVASVIGRVCPWELARYGFAGDWRRARLRFARALVPVSLEGRTVWTRYYTPSEFAAAFTPAGFETVSLTALGLLMPPPYLQGFHSRHPRLMRSLDRIERVLAAWPGARQCGDHFLMAMRKR